MDSIFIKFENVQDVWLVKELQFGDAFWYSLASVLIVLIVCFVWFWNRRAQRRHEEKIFKR